jgi:hypothetical protein
MVWTTPYVVHMGSQVHVTFMLASPNMEAKLSPDFWASTIPLNMFNYHSSRILFILYNKNRGTLRWELGLAFCSTQVSTYVPSLTSKKWCHVGIHVVFRAEDLGPLAKWQVPNFHALKSWDCTDWPRVTWNSWLGTSCEPALHVVKYEWCHWSRSWALATCLKN